MLKVLAIILRLYGIGRGTPYLSPLELVLSLVDDAFNFAFQETIFGVKVKESTS